MATRTPDVNFYQSFPRTGEPLVETPLTIPRYTPYTKSNQRARITRTPLPGRQHVKPSQRNEDSNQPSRRQQTRNEPKEDLSSVVVGKTWRVYRATPFYRLKFDKKSFKMYERQLNAWLLAERSKEPEHQSRKKTSFKLMEGDSSSVCGIEIKIASNDAKGDKQRDSVDLIAILCCGSSHEDGTSPQSVFSSVVLKGDSELTSFPVCLIKSPVLMTETFLQWLECQFGCKLSHLFFSPIDLAWLVSLCSGIGEPLRSTELTYKVPEVVPGLDTILFNIMAKDAKKLWDSIHDPKQEFFTSEEASKFLKSLESHFYHHFKIHLDQMQLVQIGTSVAYIGREGRLKILQKSYVCYVLQQIVSIAQMANIH